MLRHSGHRIDHAVLRDKIAAAGLAEAWAQVGVD
jgi:hypothetical protein